MIRVVIDTNVLVSALLSPSGIPARVLDHLLNGNITICFDSRIIAEYQAVLRRPKFGFDGKATKQVVDFIVHTGISIVPEPVSSAFDDEDDRKFYEVARSARAYLVTGNTKHFPGESIVVSPQEFIIIVESCK